jgi:prophage antirepressor-like protein
MRAFQRRRRGAPEADYGVSLPPAVLQTQVVDDSDELPLAWREHQQVTSLAPFTYEGRQLRVITDDGGVTWFVAADLCAVLGLPDTHKAVGRLDDDEKGLSSIPTPGGLQSLTTVNEPGLYSLILGSRKSEARAFKRWVTHEVLPTIRKTGSYATAPAPQLTPGIHIVASSPRHANWLWGQAVEAHVSAALMRSMSHDTQHRIAPSHFQLHLIPA